MPKSRSRPRPPVLRNPRRLLQFAGALLALLVLIYAATAATGFLRNQEKRPDPRMTGAEAPLERSAGSPADSSAPGGDRNPADRPAVPSA